MQPLALSGMKQALEIAKTRCGGRPPVVAVAGAQGSGKSWLARAFSDATPSAVALSLDDFYLPSAARRALSENIHPLFATRGVPGTHELVQLSETLNTLLTANPESRTPLPAFDKQGDEPHPPEAWHVFEGRPAAIILEGWCLGALPQTAADLAAPVNALERDEDPDGTWRNAVNHRLGTDYAALFSRLDAIVFLQAPSFDVVHAWRCQQEETALGRVLTTDEQIKIARFITYFERLTRNMLAGGRRSDLTLALDVNRQVLQITGDAV